MLGQGWGVKVKDGGRRGRVAKLPVASSCGVAGCRGSAVVLQVP